MTPRSADALSMLLSGFFPPPRKLTPPLSDLEIGFRDGAAQAYVSATAERFEVVIGMPAWLTALAAAGMTAEENRAALVGKPLTAT